MWLTPPLLAHSGSATVDPQLRQRLVFAGWSTDSPGFNNQGMSVDIIHNDQCIAKNHLCPFTRY